MTDLDFENQNADGKTDNLTCDNGETNHLEISASENHVEDNAIVEEVRKDNALLAVLIYLLFYVEHKKYINYPKLILNFCDLSTGRL